jgi:hypothetical protein
MIRRAANGLIAILLLASFVTVNFSKLIIWANYEINKAEITQKYCINKDKPGMHCCGKCLLKRKLAEEEARQNSPAMPDIKNDIQLFNGGVALAIPVNPNGYLTIHTVNKQVFLPGFHTSVFHPPCC